MGDCPECGYWIKRSIYNTWHPKTGETIAVFQCPNAHVWFEIIQSIGSVIIGGKLYDKQKLWKFQDREGLSLSKKRRDEHGKKENLPTV